MRQYILIFIFIIAAAGCSEQSRVKRQPNSRPSADVKSIDDADFEEFEEEFAQREEKIADPLEPFNRTMYNINDILYFWIIKPVSKTYGNAVPRPARTGIHNFFHNLTTPVRLVNCLLQGKFPAAGRELKRFAINTTAGVLGFGDPAGDQDGIESAQEDLGQTLAVYGLGDGFYIVWPLFGPSTLRDSFGMAGDQFLNPVRYVEPVEASIGISAFKGTNEASFHTGEYEVFKKAAIDPYIAMRNAYMQYRKNLILDEEEADTNSIEAKEKEIGVKEEE